MNATQKLCVSCVQTLGSIIPFKIHASNERFCLVVQVLHKIPIDTIHPIRYVRKGHETTTHLFRFSFELPFLHCPPILGATSRCAPYGKQPRTGRDPSAMPWIDCEYGRGPRCLREGPEGSAGFPEPSSLITYSFQSPPGDPRDHRRSRRHMEPLPPYWHQVSFRSKSASLLTTMRRSCDGYSHEVPKLWKAGIRHHRIPQH
jgi:hypothetical protein